MAPGEETDGRQRGTVQGTGERPGSEKKKKQQMKSVLTKWYVSVMVMACYVC